MSRGSLPVGPVCISCANPVADSVVCERCRQDPFLMEEGEKAVVLGRHASCPAPGYLWRLDLMGPIVPFLAANVRQWTVDYACSVEKAARDVGYSSRFGLEEGIRRTVAGYRRNGYLCSTEPGGDGILDAPVVDGEREPRWRRSLTTAEERSSTSQTTRLNLDPYSVDSIRRAMLESYRRPRPNRAFQEHIRQNKLCGGEGGSTQYRRLPTASCDGRALVRIVPVFATMRRRPREPADRRRSPGSTR